MEERTPALLDEQLASRSSKDAAVQGIEATRIKALERQVRILRRVIEPLIADIERDMRTWGFAAGGAFYLTGRQRHSILRAYRLTREKTPDV